MCLVAESLGMGALGSGCRCLAGCIWSLGARMASVWSLPFAFGNEENIQEFNGRPEVLSLTSFFPPLYCPTF